MAILPILFGTVPRPLKRRDELTGDQSASYTTLWRFRAPGYGEEIVTIPRDATTSQNFEVKMKLTETIDAIVVDADTKQPLAGVAVALVTQDDQLRSRYVEYRSLWPICRARFFGSVCAQQ